jgi:3-methyladenine DNA glycosylase AlkD
MQLFVEKLYNGLKELTNPVKKISAEAYMRNQFTFIGVDTAMRRSFFKQYLDKNKLPPFEKLEIIIDDMYKLDRDMHYCAIELAACYQQQWNDGFILLIEKLIVTNSWWDTVDAVASLLSSRYFKMYPASIKVVAGRWNRSQNIWLQRSSLLFQLKFREQTDTALLSNYILNLADSSEFFVQKAIGWVLREYAKTNRDWVLQFVSVNALKPLSRREALKHVN